jgi:hypothetical protein
MSDPVAIAHRYIALADETWKNGVGEPPIKILARAFLALREETARRGEMIGDLLVSRNAFLERAERYRKVLGDVLGWLEKGEWHEAQFLAREALRDE